MKLKSNRKIMLNKKILSILLILIFSICLFVANAFAGVCNGDESCFKCSQMDHHHPSDPKTGINPYGCQPGTPDNACGFTSSRIFDSQDFLVPTVRVDNHYYSSIPAGPAIDYGSDLFSKSSISPAHSSVVTASPPIYLLNLALLC